MAYPVSQYVEERDRTLYVAGTGVSIDSVLTRFQAGDSPDKIVRSFPSLKLSAVYGAIAYYLENEDSLNVYLAESEGEFELSAVPLSRKTPNFLIALRLPDGRSVQSVRDRPLPSGRRSRLSDHRRPSVSRTSG